MDIVLNVLAFRNPDGTFKVWATDGTGKVCYGKATSAPVFSESKVTMQTKLNDGYHHVARVAITGFDNPQPNDLEFLFKKATAGVATVITGQEVVASNTQQMVSSNMRSWLGRNIGDARNYYDRVLMDGRCVVASFRLSRDDMMRASGQASKPLRAIRSACVVAESAWNF